MILVDTSVWAAYFNGRILPETEFLDNQLRAEESEVVTTHIILAEVLQGFRTDTGFARARRLLLRLRMLAPEASTCVASAELYRTMRRRGLTVRGTADCLIAAVCVENGALLLTLDEDFVRVASCSTLRLLDVLRP